MDVSVVVPVYNEQQSIRPLYERVSRVLAVLGCSWEIVFVDDGSQDRSAQELERLAHDDPQVRVIEFVRNFGQSAALDAGIQAASGEAIVTLDGDLQNDPSEIAVLLAKLDEGYDLVHGWRRRRCDPFFRRRLPSMAANWLISRVTGVRVHDLGCTAKAMRRELAVQLELRGGRHRFIPVLAHLLGARWIEVVTRHHPRRFGRSKYGLWRVVPVMRDLAAIAWQIRLGSPSRRRPVQGGYRIRRMLNFGADVSRAPRAALAEPAGCEL